jgi:hypothetical protein
MNEKTYCPLGKIDCKSYNNEFGGRCLGDGKDWLINNFEVCPWPSSQRKIERYNMCEDQPAQIQCHRVSCFWHEGYVCRCKNISPAILIHGMGAEHCYSYLDK